MTNLADRCRGVGLGSAIAMTLISVLCSLSWTHGSRMELQNVLPVSGAAVLLVQVNPMNAVTAMTTICMPSSLPHRDGWAALLTHTWLVPLLAVPFWRSRDAAVEACAMGPSDCASRPGRPRHREPALRPREVHARLHSNNCRPANYSRSAHIVPDSRAHPSISSHRGARLPPQCSGSGSSMRCQSRQLLKQFTGQMLRQARSL